MKIPTYLGINLSWQRTNYYDQIKQNGCMTIGFYSSNRYLFKSCHTEGCYSSNTSLNLVTLLASRLLIVVLFIGRQVRQRCELKTTFFSITLSLFLSLYLSFYHSFFLFSFIFVSSFYFCLNLTLLYFPIYATKFLSLFCHVSLTLIFILSPPIFVASLLLSLSYSYPSVCSFLFFTQLTIVFLASLYLQLLCFMYSPS